MHTEDQAGHDETVNDDAADALEQAQIADAQMTETTVTAQADAALATSVAQAQQWRGDHDAAAWKTYQDSRAIGNEGFTGEVATFASNQADDVSDAWDTYRNKVADINLKRAQLGPQGYPDAQYEQNLKAAATTLQDTIATANNTFSHQLIGQQKELADDRAMIVETLQISYDADAAGYGNRVETADGVAEKAIAAAQAAQDMANVAASDTDLTTQAADLAAAVSQIAPADKGYWDGEAGFQEQEDVSDAGAAQTRDTTELTAYDAAVHAWAQSLAAATPSEAAWATEQVAFADADVAWQENVDGAEVSDVQQTDDAETTWTKSVDTADTTQETGDAGALSTAAAAVAGAQSAAASAVDTGLPAQQALASDATTTYDDAVLSAAQTEADGEATQRSALQTSVNDAYFTYLGAVADAQLAVATGSATPAQAAGDLAAAQSTQRQTVAAAWVNWAEKVAGLQTTEVSDVGAAKSAWQTSEAAAENATVGIIGDAAAGLTGGLADAATGLVSGLATDEGNWEAAVAGAGATLTSGAIAADQALTHSEPVADQQDEMGYVSAEAAYDETTVEQWAAAVGNALGGVPSDGPDYALLAYDAAVADAEKQEVVDDDQALVSDAQTLTGAEVTLSDEEESAVVDLADGVSQAAADEVRTTAPEEAAAVGAAATDTAGAVGQYADAQDAFIQAAAGALTGDDTATVKANVTYDNRLASDAQTYVDNVAPAAAALYLAGYTPAAWAAYNQVVQTQTAQEQSSDKAANVTRVGQIGTAEVAEAGGLGAAQATLATAAGTVETGLVGELADNDNALAGDEAGADEGFYAALGGDLASFLTGMAQADQDWVTSAGAPIEDYQQTLGGDEVTAAHAIAEAEAAYGAAGSDSSLEQAFITDSTDVAQDDANDQDALVDDAVTEASGEANAAAAYAEAEGPAVIAEISGVATADDDYAVALTANLGSDAEQTAAADATQYSSLAEVQAAYTVAAAQADADYQNWLVTNDPQSPTPNPQPQELADAQLALTQGQADANLAWVESKDAADEGFAMTDATDWASMAKGEAGAEEGYTVADDAATADYEAGVAAAQGGQTNGDTQAAATQADDDAAAGANYQEAQASAQASEEKAALDQEAQSYPQSAAFDDWLVYEDFLIDAQAAYQQDEAAQQVKYTDAVEQNEVNYVSGDVSDYLAELGTILADDLTGGASDSTMAANDLAQFNTTVGDEVTFETTLSPDAQAYQDTLAEDAHDAAWADAQAAHDLAVGTIDAATYASEVSAAAATQSADDAAAAALYQSQVGGATVTQIESDADAALTDATLDAGAVKGASDGDAQAVQSYTKQESAAYEGEAEGDAAALAQEQLADASDWASETEFYLNGDDYPSAMLVEAEAQARQMLVQGGTAQNVNYDGYYGEGTAAAEQDLTDALAQDQATQEQDDADAQYARDLAADLDQYNLSVAEAQAAHDAQYALAASDQALIDAGAFPADLPSVAQPSSAGFPLTATANYGLTETIGGYAMGPTTATSTSLVGAMFSAGPDMGVPYSGWTGWPGWSGADAPPNPGTPNNNSNNDPTGGPWTDGGAPPEAPQILGFVDGDEPEGDGDQNQGGGAPAQAQPPAPAAPTARNGSATGAARKAPGPWNLLPNWQDATGALVLTYQEVVLNLGSASEAKRLKVEDAVWQALANFSGFNGDKERPNIATVRLIRPDEQAVKDSPQLEGALDAEFTTVDRDKVAGQKALGASDGPNGEVFVRLFVNENARSIVAVTLGNHMIVGIRKWDVISYVAEQGSQRISEGDSVIRIRTSAWEQRNSRAIDAAFKVAGKSDMMLIWKSYLQAIARNVTSNVKDFVLTLYIEHPSRELPAETPNPYSADLPVGFRQEGGN